MIEDILSQVRKPGRYIGQEWNMSRKDFALSEIKFALCFPDLYEVGMSNLGIRIIYGLLNNIPDVACERFFSPDYDMELALRKNNTGIFSLESRKNLADFDIIGFSLAYELCYTNVLNILELGAIPLKSNLRDNSYPLVIAGGPSVLNPEPMHEFFDLFVIGEAEEALPEIVDVYRKLKAKFKSYAISKQDLLLEFCRIEGVYVPSFYEVAYFPESKIERFYPKIEGVPALVRKRFVKDLNSSYSPSDWVVPYIQIVHDRICVEVMRGCPNKCRFCQARSQYFPFRIKEAGAVSDLASLIYKRTGYEEVSLCGLSVSDYPCIEELLENLIGFFKDKAVSVSLPSIKPKTMLGNLTSLISTIKKTGLTFAPEAASEKLRKILNKDFDIPSFLRSLEDAYASGYRHIKLYFLTGLPYEDDNDLESIIDFANSASELRIKKAKSPALVNVSINTLIPKPHTPFQWLEMQGLESIKQKQDFLKNKSRNRRLNLNFHNRYMSVLEAVLSRGDRRLSSVILSAFKKGARFDAWKDYFMFDRWVQAFDDCKLDYNFYLRMKQKEEIMPWDFVDTGIGKDYLRREFEGISETV